MTAKSGFSTPAQQGWADGKAVREVSCVPQTGKPPASAKATRPSLTEAERSSPSTTSTRSGSRPASLSASRVASGEAPSRGGAEAGGVGPLTSWSRMSIGSDKKTGPQGGVRAMAKARRNAWPTSSPRRTSFAHLAIGAASATRSPESHGSVIRWRVSCWPAVTTSGVSLAFEAASTPIALPRPPMACRLTNAARPDASAQPSAIATAVASCRPRT